MDPKDTEIDKWSSSFLSDNKMALNIKKCSDSPLSGSLVAPTSFSVCQFVQTTIKKNHKLQGLNNESFLLLP